MTICIICNKEINEYYNVKYCAHCQRAYRRGYKAGHQSGYNCRQNKMQRDLDHSRNEVKKAHQAGIMVGKLLSE